LALNPDIALEADVLEKIVEEMDKDKALGSAMPKILRWDFNNQKKTDIIDSCGLKLLPGLRFVDYKAGEPAGVNFAGEVIGVSGALAIYRLSALEKIKQNGQYFDELMFMYKEDCDLAYRLFLGGFKAKCVSDAIAYHDRTVRGVGEKNIEIALNRKNKSRQAREWSFLNQQIIFMKYWRLQSRFNKLAIVWFEFKMLIFILFFEPYLLKELMNFNKIRYKILRYKSEN